MWHASALEQRMFGCEVRATSLSTYSDLFDCLGALRDNYKVSVSYIPTVSSFVHSPRLVQPVFTVASEYLGILLDNLSKSQQRRRNIVLLSSASLQARMPKSC